MSGQGHARCWHSVVPCTRSDAAGREEPEGAQDPEKSGSGAIMDRNQRTEERSGATADRDQRSEESSLATTHRAAMTEGRLAAAAGSTKVSSSNS